MTTLAEAIELGQGIERPFHCEAHDDRFASASVNVLKGVWVCYACRASGSVGKAKSPSVDLLAQMLEPDKTCRVYPRTYLELFSEPTYWRTRFPDWLCWWAGLGEDPVTGHATFPVHTPAGLLAGVCRRIGDEEVAAAKEAGDNPSRYRYPWRWSASRVIGDMVCPPGELLVLVEGYADAVSLWEVGIPAAPVYGSALHLPQVERVLRRKPKLTLVGLDNDDAGAKGTVLTLTTLGSTELDVGTLQWPAKDPGELSPERRLRAVVSVVGEAYLSSWQQAVANMQAAYARHLEENAA